MKNSLNETNLNNYYILPSSEDPSKYVVHLNIVIDDYTLQCEDETFYDSRADAFQSVDSDGDYVTIHSARCEKSYDKLTFEKLSLDLNQVSDQMIFYSSRKKYKYPSIIFLCEKGCSEFSILEGFISDSYDHISDHINDYKSHEEMTLKIAHDFLDISDYFGVQSLVLLSSKAIN